MSLLAKTVRLVLLACILTATGCNFGLENVAAESNGGKITSNGNQSGLSRVINEHCCHRGWRNHSNGDYITIEFDQHYRVNSVVLKTNGHFDSYGENATTWSPKRTDFIISLSSDGQSFKRLGSGFFSDSYCKDERNKRDDDEEASYSSLTTITCKPGFLKKLDATHVRIQIDVSSNDYPSASDIRIYEVEVWGKEFSVAYDSDDESL